MIELSSPARLRQSCFRAVVFRALRITKGVAARRGGLISCAPPETNFGPGPRCAAEASRNMALHRLPPHRPATTAKTAAWREGREQYLADFLTGEDCLGGFKWHPRPAFRVQQHFVRHAICAIVPLHHAQIRDPLSSDGGPIFEDRVPLR